jgi:hypothetical protein
MRIQVEFHYEHDTPMPRALHFDGRRVIEVVEMLDQWFGHDYRYIKVRGRDDALYILRFDELRAEWELTMFARRGSALSWAPWPSKASSLR